MTFVHIFLGVGAVCVLGAIGLYYYCVKYAVDDPTEDEWTEEQYWGTPHRWGSAVFGGHSGRKDG